MVMHNDRVGRKGAGGGGGGGEEGERSVSEVVEDDMLGTSDVCTSQT